VANKKKTWATTKTSLRICHVCVLPARIADSFICVFCRRESPLRDPARIAGDKTYCPVCVLPARIADSFMFVFCRRGSPIRFLRPLGCRKADKCDYCHVHEVDEKKEKRWQQFPTLERSSIG